MKHLFFDWDGTLWDFHTNAGLALHEVFSLHNLLTKFESFEQFKEKFHHYNSTLWKLYSKAQISKQEVGVKRFALAFADVNLYDDDFSQLFSQQYLEAMTLQTKLLPHAKEMVEYLCKKYNLHIITNGFSEVQFPKIEKSGLRHCFSEIITSEEAGALKPNAKIFELALAKTGANLSNSIIIGDDLDADIKGAIDFGMKNVFVNLTNLKHNYTTDYEISNLLQLKQLF